jgi:ATP-dependent DNA ligase
MVLKPSIPPMEARSAEEIPTGDEWQYEPKWDGFRCLAFRDDDNIFLQSKNGQPWRVIFQMSLRTSRSCHSKSLFSMANW